MTGLAKPLAGFLREYLPHERGVSPHTVESYVTSFRMLVTFVAGRLGTQPCRLEVMDIGTGNLLQFLDHLETGRGNCVNTRNVRLAAVKAFFRYLEFRHPEHLDLAAQVRAIPLKKGDRRVVDCLTRGEIRALLGAPRPETRTELRDRAMLCLAYNAGLRLSELVSLHVGSVSQPELDLVRVMGKGRRERMARTDPAALERDRRSAAGLARRAARQSGPAPVPQFPENRNDRARLRQAPSGPCRGRRVRRSLDRRQDRDAAYAASLSRVDSYLGLQPAVTASR